MNEYILYARPGSGSFVVQVALEEIGLPYERIWVAGDEPALQAYKKITPTGKVPALALPDGTVMFESAAILTHLSLAHPHAEVSPKPGTTQHALFLQWMTFLSANVYEAVLRIYYPYRYSSQGEQDAAAIREQATRDYLAHLSLIGESLQPYVLGARSSIADSYLYMLAGWYPEGRTELHARVPKLSAHGQHVSRRPAVAKAEADHAT
jgi:glutathione S-transferase